MAHIVSCYSRVNIQLVGYHCDKTVIRRTLSGVRQPLCLHQDTATRESYDKGWLALDIYLSISFDYRYRFSDTVLKII